MPKYLFLCLFFIATSAGAKEALLPAPGLDLLRDSYLVAKADAKVNEFEDEEVSRWPYTVQVASYISEQDAIVHVEKLKKLDKKVFYFPTFTRGQVWFKVCAGRFSDRASAEKFRKTVVQKADEPFAIVIALQSSSDKRSIASVKEKPLDLKKEASELPIQDSKKSKTEPLSVSLIKKDVVKVTSAVNTQSKDFRYTLQVASFPSKEDALKKVASLEGEGPGRVQESEVSGKTWYRVLLGEFDSKKEADAFRAVYQEKTNDKSAFVKRLEK